MSRRTSTSSGQEESPATPRARWQARAEEASLLRRLHHPRLENFEEQTRRVRPWLLSGTLLVAAAVLFANRFMAAAGLILLAISGAAWVWYQFSLAGVSYTRTFRDADGLVGRPDEVRAFLGETVSLTLCVRNQKPLPLNWLQITDVFPTDLPVSGGDVRFNRITNQGEFSTFWMPGAYQTLERAYTITCAERGYHLYGPAVLSSGDGFGFFTRRATLTGYQRLIIYPHLYTAAELHLPAKNPFGEKASKQRLFEDPLRNAGIREWQPGDSMRRIHWKATARHQELLSRVYEPSEEAQVQIILNVATLERYWEGVVSELLERTVSVAGSVAQLAIERRYATGITANGYLPGSDQNIRLLPGRSRDQLTYILELLAAVTPYASRPIERLLLSEAPRLPWGATLLIVTAVVYPALLETLYDLERSGRRLVLFTLAEEPPERQIPGVTVYHLPHLRDDLIVPEVIAL